MDLTKCPSCGKPYFHDEGKLLTKASLPEHRLCVVCASNFPIWADELLRDGRHLLQGINADPSTQLPKSEVNNLIESILLRVAIRRRMTQAEADELDTRDPA
jgi:hypothetical protein